MTAEAQLDIRLARQEEAGLVLEIIIDAANWLTSIGLPTWNLQSLPAIMIPAVERGEVYLAWQDQQALGTFSLQWEDVTFWGETPPDAGYLHKLAVRRSGGGRNLGRRMIAYAEELVKVHHRPFLKLDCDSRNEKLNRYYLRAGFEFAGTRLINMFRFNLYQKRLAISSDE